MCDFRRADGRSSICQGDSGGGLVVPKDLGGESVHYLHGIVSNGKRTAGGCDFSFYTLFTNIEEYGDMIKKALASYPTV